MKILLGSTGLVGSTLLKSRYFDYCYNTKNFQEFENNTKDGDDIVLCCLPAAKWLVNKNVNLDLKNIFSIVDKLSNYTYNSVILISTIDIYNDSPLESNEFYSPNIKSLNYGSNRYLFELLLQQNIKTNNLKIFRLPALFNNLIKKNILYDLINNYNLESININSLYQWYNLDNLSNDIERYMQIFPDQRIFNLFTEPIHTKDIASLFPYDHKIYRHNETIIRYDYHTAFGGGNTNYIQNKEKVLTEIKKFTNDFKPAITK
jgi:hypothetical protein